MSDVELMLADFHAALDDERGRGDAPLRITLHNEENAELIEALYALRYAKVFGYGRVEAQVGRREALARELADIVYVAYGTAHAFDIDLDMALEEVHRAAMSKLEPKCSQCSGHGQTVVTYPDDPDEYEICEACDGTGEGKRVVREDGKIMKPEGFVSPDMSGAV